MKTSTRWLTLLLAVLPLALMGCFTPFQPRVAANRGISEPPPRPDSPRNLLRLFEWCWENRSITEYRELFTKDFRFVFATADSTGNAYLDHGWTREDELVSSMNLFLGGNANQPAATKIILDFDANLIALPDSRPGKTNPWHKEIYTRIDLIIDTDALETRTIGSVRFFVVSGDSAQIPEELGLGPDPNRWYIERYEEENPVGLLSGAGLEGAASAPRHEMTDEPPRATVRPAGSRAGRRGSAVRPEHAQFPASWGFVKSIYR